MVKRSADPSKGDEGDGDAESNGLSSKKPKPKALPFESTYLRAIPRAQQYEKSFMHRDTISHAIATVTDFIITASVDGHLKLWKKKHSEGIEFVKHFRCHLYGFSHIAINHNGTLMVTVCTQDKSMKIFDVPNFDMINMFKLDFAPKVAAWIHQGNDVMQALAVTDSESSRIFIYDGKGDDKPINIIEKLHSKPIRIIEYNAVFDCVISIDIVGMLEYWSGPKHDFQFPTNITWKYKTDTDLYEFVKLKSAPRCLVIAPDGRRFAAVGIDRRIRIFDFMTGKLQKTIDETLQSYMEQAKLNKHFGLQNMEWNRRVALEKELDRDENTFQHMSICFDETSNFLIYPTPVGIKVVNLFTDETVREIGKGENIRFLGVSLCRAVPDVRERLQVVVSFILMGLLSLLFQSASLQQDLPESRITDHAIIHTTYGDIHIKLHPHECPKAVENFCTHARRGYYNGHTFHRVIKGFMIQTGDPTGKGTGGQSIWGDDFEDEFHPRLKHDKPFMVSMANAGPNTNGSQFFITVIPADWLDGKNTLFGQVTEGFNVVQKISQVSTYEKSGRPKEEISIISITLK
ncbi:unnamed protein product [Anisakis simplex]|uniref:peptidylprolyl isomerase n=1 Tax=Anisakis simplex TaxID=6269 RepID=A0A0M3KBH3_ANISI|nr:unnamed protein product [Anisakis simplex]